MAAMGRRVDFRSGSVIQNYIRFVIPIILSSVLHLFFNTADMIVVGKFVSDSAQAAVSSTGALITSMVCLATGLSSGINVLMARYVGADDHETASCVVHTALTTALGLGSGLAVLCLLTAPFFLKLMEFPPEIMEQAILYLRIYFFGLPLQLFFEFGAATMRGQGDSRRPMLCLTTGGVVNVLTNLLFVLGFGCGVEGVAIATVLSYAVSAALVFWCMRHDSGPGHFDYKSMGINWPMLGKIARIGIPAGIQGMTFSLSSVLVQSSMNSLGAIAVTGAGAAGNLTQYANMVGNSASAACVTFAAQNMGANQPQRLRKGYRQMSLLVMGVDVVVSLLILGLAPLALWMFTNDPAVVQEALIHIRVMLPFHWIHGYMQCTQGTQRGLGASIGPMIVTILGTCVLRVCWATAIFPLRPTHAFLVFGYPVTWMVTTIAQRIHLGGLFNKVFAGAEAKQA